jgi:hypothetical protein
VNQHDHHDSGTSDELGRRAAAALLADVERRTDVDAALRRLHDGSATEVVPLASRIGDSGRDRRRMVWLGAAAAAVAVVGTVTVVAMRDDGPGRVVPASPDTVDGAAPDAPRNTTDATTVPDTTPTDTTDDTTPPSAPVTTTPAEETDPTTAVEPTLPSVPATEIDALAGLVPPAPPATVDVPAMLPPTPFAGPSDAVRRDYQMPLDEVTTLTQTWVSPEGAMLQIVSQRNGSSSPSGFQTADVPVDVWPWDEAGAVSSMVDGYGMVILHDPSGSTSLWGAGITNDELVAIARTMSIDPSADAWRLGADSPGDLVLLHEGWNTTAFASRTLQWEVGDQRGELVITLGSPDSIRLPYQFESPAFLDSVGDATALVGDISSGAAISWSPAPDVVVVLGISGTVDEVVAMARSLEFVDVATWEAASTPNTSTDDGCGSYFFC